MTQKSAGVVMYRLRDGVVEVLLAHPGGPFWAKKDDGAWSIPKGLMEDGESSEAAARREFAEETGIELRGAMTALGAYRQPSGKIVEAWAIEGDCDPKNIRSNTFEMEWPPKSGAKSSFPEIDRADWFSPGDALVKILKGQQPILAALYAQLGLVSPGDTRHTAICETRKARQAGLRLRRKRLCTEQRARRRRGR
jgi:predicted NUDIX family NTP pyrophosphohydrolase